MMEVSLKKAGKLASTLLAKAKAPERSVAMDVYASEDAQLRHERLREKFITDLNSALAVVDAGYALRQLVGQANQTAGVSSKLTLRAAMARKLELLGAELPDEEPDFGAIDDRAEALRTPDANSRRAIFGDDTVNLPVALEEDVAELRQSLTRALAALDDELAELNHTTKITVPDEVEKVLREHFLI